MTFCTFRSGQMVSKRHGRVFYQANDEHDPTERTIERGPGEATRRDIGNFASRLALFRVTLNGTKVQYSTQESSGTFQSGCQLLPIRQLAQSNEVTNNSGVSAKY
jgi:hypothetical protein